MYAASPMLDVLQARAASNQAQQVPSVAIQSGITDLKKLRPIADPNVRPLIDAWVRFIEAWSALQQGTGSTQNMETQRQALVDQMAKEQANVEMMQKML